MKEVTARKGESEPQEGWKTPEKMMREQCDGYGVCYATASKIYVTSDVNIASQQLGIPRQPNC
jgi:hypothetical protein